MFTKCHSCKNDSFGKFRCKTCSVKHNKNNQEKHKKIYLERKNAGLCICCGKKRDTSFFTCSFCRKKQYQKTKECDQKRREEGKCHVRTCENPRLNDCKFCEKHRLLDLNTRKERFFKLMENDLCTSCGSEKYMNHFKNRNTKTKHCQVCYLKLLSVTYLGKADKWKELLNLLEKQNCLCPYTGDKLILGESASIDHVLSKSKYPEKQKDINNLVWVSRIVNRMKHNYTHREFMNLIEKIYNYRKKMERGKKVPSPSP